MLLVAVVLMFAGQFVYPEPASADIVFQLVNNSGKTFKKIWVGPSSNGIWVDRDRFRNKDGYSTSLRSGYHMDLYPNMSGRSDVQFWDIKVVTTDGKKYEWHNIDLFNIYQVEIDRKYTAHFSR